MFTKECEYVVIETTSVTVFLYVYLLDFSEQADSFVCLKTSILKRKIVKTGVWSKVSRDKTENLAKFEVRLDNYVMYKAVPGHKRR